MKNIEKFKKTSNLYKNITKNIRFFKEHKNLKYKFIIN